MFPGVGSNQEVPVDVRIIAATNRKLEQRVSAGEFREDLFFRINVLNLQIPPLRERIDDIKELSQYFIDTISLGLGVKPSRLSNDELVLLAAYDWPGNVRELKNVIERSLLLNSLPSEAIGGIVQQASSDETEETSTLLADVEKHHILKILNIENGNKSAAARRLGVSRKTLDRKVIAWGKAI